MRYVLIIFTLILLSGCATSGNKNLDATAMTVSTIDQVLTKEELVSRFGKPLATKDVGPYELLGYRKRDVRMNAWSIVPFVGLVAGGVEENYTTCIAKILRATGFVEGVSCFVDSNFQSNAETMVGDRVSKKEFEDIFGKPIKK